MNIDGDKYSKIGIIIVNWNTGELLANCLNSLALLEDSEKRLIDEVIVIDNASTDKSVVKAEVVVGRNLNQPRVRFVRQGSNLGFAVANNVGIEKLTLRHENAMPHILLLNPDTEVTKGTFFAMLNVFTKYDEAGIVGPKLKNPDGTVQNSIRSFPTFYTLMLHLMKLGRIIDTGNYEYDSEQVVDQVMGAAFLIRNKAWRDVGALDEGYWIWFEEVDYCKRAKNLGWDTHFTPDGEIMHVGAVSFDQLVGYKKALIWLKSLMRYAKKNLDKRQVLLLRLFVPISLLLVIPVSLSYLLKKKN